MNFKDLWKQYLRTGDDQSYNDLGFNSRWKRCIAEGEIHNLETVYGPEEYEQLDQEIPSDQAPEEIYHATRPPLLSSISREGLKDTSGFSRHGSGQSGISFTTSIDPLVSGSFGNVVMVFDGKQMALSGQYRFMNHQDPSIDNDEMEVRVSMIDSASDSGSGIDPKVDSLGTVIPFHFCKKLIFLQPLPKFELKWLKENFPSIEIQVLKSEPYNGYKF
jgi:hypothetical protein